MTDHQPDFTATFFKTFAADAHLVQYSIRRCGNLLHDLAFASSLAHDARVLTPDIQPQNGCVRIAINRDCWELGYTEHDGASELHIVDSELRVSGVQSMEWTFRKQMTDSPWLDYLWIDPGFRHDPRFNFYLVGEHWKCTITLAASDWVILLSDLEIPYLWSSRNIR